MSGLPVATLGQLTRVCVKNGKVTKMSVDDAYTDTHGRPFMKMSEPMKATRNVGWEGRGVARSEMVLGIEIPGVGSFGSKRTLCARMNLNADGKHFKGEGRCNL